MKLYVIRHGRTNDNDLGLYNGRYDEDINSVGIEQAKKASKKVKKLDLDLIICSPLLRTKHTAEIVNVNNVPIIYDDLLMERDFGSLTGKPWKNVEEDIWNYKKKLPYEGLESVKDLFDRVYLFLDNIKTKYQDKNILIVTHGGVARGIYTYFNGYPNQDSLAEYGRQDNCEIKEYEW